MEKLESCAVRTELAQIYKVSGRTAMQQKRVPLEETVDIDETLVQCL